MDLQAFDQLCLDERAQIVWQSTFIKSITEGEKRYNLYRGEDFFIEVEYSEEENIITTIRAFTGDKPLQRYGDAISLKL